MLWAHNLHSKDCLTQFLTGKHLTAKVSFTLAGGLLSWFLWSALMIFVVCSHDFIGLMLESCAIIKCGEKRENQKWRTENQSSPLTVSWGNPSLYCCGNWRCWRDVCKCAKSKKTTHHRPLCTTRFSQPASRPPGSSLVLAPSQGRGCCNQFANQLPSVAIKLVSRNFK